MVTRWEVTKAVRASDLPAPSRLIMLTLADVAEVGTAEIPARHTPSLTVLAAETGLSKSTIKDHLARLETAGWLVRERPDKKAQWSGERTRYRLDCPRPVAGPGVGQDATLGQNAAQGGPQDSPGVGQELAPSRPGDGHLDQITSDQGQITVRSPSSSKPKKAPKMSKALAVIDRPDVEQVCRHLADRIEANGSKRPTVTQTWRDAARRLIDRDGRTVEQIVRAIDWCQDDTFWKANVMSMPKLREQYDRLRLAAQRNGHKPSTTDQRMAAAQALKAKLRGMS